MKGFKLSRSQLKSLAEISRDIAQVMLAGWVITPLITKEADWLFVISGLVLTLFFWYINLRLAKRLRI